MQIVLLIRRSRRVARLGEGGLVLNEKKQTDEHGRKRFTFRGPLKSVSLSRSVSGKDADWCHLDDITYVHGEVDVTQQTLALFPIYFMQTGITEHLWNTAPLLQFEGN